MDERLQALLNEQQYAFNQATLGRVPEVLIERDGKRGRKLGKSPWLQSVIIENRPPAGTLLPSRSYPRRPNSLIGIAAARRAA